MILKATALFLPLLFVFDCWMLFFYLHPPHKTIYLSSSIIVHIILDSKKKALRLLLIDFPIIRYCRLNQAPPILGKANHFSSRSYTFTDTFTSSQIPWRESIMYWCMYFYCIRIHFSYKIQYALKHINLKKGFARFTHFLLVVCLHAISNIRLDQCPDFPKKSCYFIFLLFASVSVYCSGSDMCLRMCGPRPKWQRLFEKVSLQALF